MLKAINDRRAVRQYSSDKLTDDQVQNLVAAFQAAPCGMGQTDVMQGLVIQDPALLNAVEESTGNACYGAPFLLVILTKKDSQFGERDASVAAENVMVEAADLGLGSVYVMGGAVKLNQDSATRAKLGISSDFDVTTIVPVGKSAAAPNNSDRSNRYQVTMK